MTPRCYSCHRATARPDLSGELDKPFWQAAPWSDDFVPPVGTGAKEVPHVFVLCHNPVQAGDDAVCGTLGLAPRLGDLRYNLITDIAAPIASGSFKTKGMIVAPCSVRTMSEIATGVTTSLLTRAADVMLKERRPLVLMVRETPLHLGHLRNMTALAEMGAIILPPVLEWSRDLSAARDSGGLAVSVDTNEALPPVTQGSTSVWGQLLVANGRLRQQIHECEQYLDDHSWLTRKWQGPTQNWLTRWVGLGNEKVYVGRDGWLFYRPDVDQITGPGFLDPHVLARRERAGDQTRRGQRIADVGDVVPLLQLEHGVGSADRIHKPMGRQERQNYQEPSDSQHR